MGSATEKESDIRSQGSGASVATFNHLCLAVADTERSVTFYREHFGAILLKIVAGGRVVFLRLPGDLVLELFRKLDGPTTARGHLAFQVADAERACRYFRDTGLVCTDSQRRPSGNSIVILHDPDGHEIELLEHAAGMDPTTWSA